MVKAAPEFGTQQWRDDLADVLEANNGTLQHRWVKAAIYALRHESRPIVLGNALREAFEMVLIDLADTVERSRRVRS